MSLRRSSVCALGMAWLTCASLVGAAAAADDAEELVIGLIPELNVFEQVRRYEALADHLSDRLGIPIRLTMLSRYGNIVERIRAKEVDAAFLGSFPGALASAQLGWLPIARPVNMDGTSTYWGHIFVRKDSGITAVEQLRGCRIALVERATTAGYIFPVAFFRDNGVEDVEEVLSELQFWGSHDSSIMAVLEGRADVGAAKNTVWDRLRRQNPRIDSELEIIASSPRVPSNGLLVSPEIDDGVREKIRHELLGLADDPASARVLEALGARGFVATDADSYLPVMELTAEAGIDLASYTYQNR